MKDGIRKWGDTEGFVDYRLLFHQEDMVSNLMIIVYTWSRLDITERSVREVNFKLDLV